MTRTGLGLTRVQRMMIALNWVMKYFRKRIKPKCINCMISKMRCANKLPATNNTHAHVNDQLA
jgi:hypothetical protein